MAFLRFETPLPEPLSVEEQAEMLVTPREDIDDWLAKRGREPAGYSVIQNPPGGTDETAFDSITVTSGHAPDNPLLLTRETARQRVENGRGKLVPPGQAASEAQLDAIQAAVHAWLETPALHTRTSDWTPPSNAEVDRALALMLLEGEYRTHAKAIGYATLTGKRPEPSRATPPSGFPEFRQCVTLIQRIPETAEGLRILALHSGRWDFLRDYWDALIHILEEADRSDNYSAIRRILEDNYQSLPL